MVLLVVQETITAIGLAGDDTCQYVYSYEKVDEDEPPKYGCTLTEFKELIEFQHPSTKTRPLPPVELIHVFDMCGESGEEDEFEVTDEDALIEFDRSGAEPSAESDASGGGGAALVEVD